MNGFLANVARRGAGLAVRGAIGAATPPIAQESVLSAGELSRARGVPGALAGSAPASSAPAVEATWLGQSTPADRTTSEPKSVATSDTVNSQVAAAVSAGAEATKTGVAGVVTPFASEPGSQLNVELAAPVAPVKPADPGNETGLLRIRPTTMAGAEMASDTQASAASMASPIGSSPASHAEAQLVTAAPAETSLLLSFPRARRQPAPSAAMPIHVRIGRVEVRAPATAPVARPAPPAGAAPRASPGFASYFRVRSYRN